MRPGTLVRLPDGREGRVVYNGLDGVGIKWGDDPVDVAAILGCCPLFGDAPTDPKVLQWAPDAMLRDPYQGADIECVGTEWEIAHSSDCAANNEPALPAGDCDCGAEPRPTTPKDPV